MPRTVRSVSNSDRGAPEDKSLLAEHLRAKRIDDRPEVVGGPAEPQEAARAGGDVLPLETEAGAHGHFDGRAYLFAGDQLQLLHSGGKTGTVADGHSQSFICPQKIIAEDELIGPVAQLEEIAGLMERVTFFKEDSGFAVLRVKVRGQRDQVTVLGSLPAVSAGEWPGCLYSAVRGP